LFDQRHEPFDGSGNVFDSSQKLFETIQYPLELWDRIDEALVERVISGQTAPSSVLPIHWVLAGADEAPIALRIADEQEELVATRAEARRTEVEARQVAEARILELEAEMRRLKNG